MVKKQVSMCIELWELVFIVNKCFNSRASTVSQNTK